jgi:hypothetical protein
MKVFENGVLRRRGPLGCKRDEVTGGWRRLEKVAYLKLHNLYPSHNIIRVIKSRTLRWAGHVARVGDMKNDFSRESLRKRPCGRH